MLLLFPLALSVVAPALGQVVTASQAPTAPQSQHQQDAANLTISGAPGVRPKYAVPDFVALPPEPDVLAAAKVLGQLLWDDLNAERELYMIPRDTYASIPGARSIDAVPFDRWKELGANAVISGTVTRDRGNLKVQLELFGVSHKQSAFSREFSGPAENPRALAQTMADEISKQQRAFDGLARTKSTSVEDHVTGPGGYLDVQNFCCPEYLTTMIQLIRRSWNGQQDVAGQTLMKFTVMRDGHITSVQIERSSGYYALDQAAQRALLATRQLLPLPPQFPDQSLTIHLNFQYVTH